MEGFWPEIYVFATFSILQLCLSVTPDREAAHLIRAEDVLLRPLVHLVQRLFKPCQVDDGVVVRLHDELGGRTALAARPEETQHHLVGGHLVPLRQGTLTKERSQMTIYGPAEDETWTNMSTIYQYGPA